MQELKTLDDIFDKRIFRIPDYQRGYAWGEKQLVDFWEDLMNLDENRLHYTGVLSIKKVPEEKWQLWNDEQWLIERRRNVPFYVVDGQQRLTTVSIFLKCLSNAIKNLPENYEKPEDEIYLGSFSLKEINEKFIVVTQPPNNIIKTYKFGYETDNPSFKFLRHKIFGEPDAGKIDETFYTLNLENAFKFFQDNLIASIEKNGERVLEEIYVKLTQRFMFNLYELSDDFDVFVAFETMNNRGKKLSDLELLKNRLIYLTTLYSNKEVPENDKNAIRDNINNAWGEVYYQLGRNKKQPLNDDDFLRAHWIMYFKYSRKKGNDYIKFLLDDQFNPRKVLEKIEVKTSAISAIEEIKEEASIDDDFSIEEEIPSIEMIANLNINEINEYVLSLKSAAKHWYNSFNPLANADLLNNESQLLDRINRIGVGYFRPLIMSLFVTESVSNAEREKVLHAIERFIFLCFRVSRAMSNNKSSVYYGCARDLYKGTIYPQTIVDWLNNDLQWSYTDNGLFKISYFSDFIFKKYKAGNTGYYGWNGLRYFLYEYEEELKISRGLPKFSWANFIKNEKDKISIEHILPQTATHPDWIDNFGMYSESENKYLNGSLGNLLPLSSSINSSLQNDCFEDKKNTKIDLQGKVIRNGYSNGSYSEQEVAHVANWTPENIKERGLSLLNFMEKRWNINIGDRKEKLNVLHLSFLEKEEVETVEIT